MTALPRVGIPGGDPRGVGQIAQTVIAHPDVESPDVPSASGTPIPVSGLERWCWFPGLG
jgi:hypothetical protein